MAAIEHRRVAYDHERSAAAVRERFGDAAWAVRSERRLREARALTEPGAPTIAQRWAQSHTFSHREFPLSGWPPRTRPTVSVCLPARNEARTIGRILGALDPLRGGGIIDQIVVVDHSSDGTGEIARRLGAEVLRPG